MKAVRDSMGCTWADLHGRENDEIVNDAIAAMSFAKKRDQYYCYLDVVFRWQNFGRKYGQSHPGKFRDWLVRNLYDKLEKGEL